MAKTIDQKVVEMRFDNRQFEQNTKQTMSTLDKLKAKLSFKGASDGLEQINKSAKKVNMDGLVSGVETVSAKFSAMDIIATTALVNITNSAINAGKRLVASISTDQITAGWTKMQQQMGSTQTLMNSTGKEIDEIEGYLDKLMWYSDETSYGFTDMTTALANMTATGGDIEKLVPMIMGIANATAYAGKGAAEFSRVIYNLNQSYGGGYLNLMDWKSVQSAGANSKQLTESLIRWGEELGTIKKGQVTIGNFNDSLKDRWATTQVMEKSFGEFADFTLKVKEAVDAGDYSTASQAIEALSKDYVGISATAFKAAQEAKSFTEAVDATKDAVSSGWMRVFKTIFGNYDEQRALWTDLANSLWDIFAAPIDRLEGFLRKALGFDMIKNMWDKINNNPIMDALKEVDGAIKKSSKSLEEYQAIITKVWRGDFNNRGDNPDRFDLLSQAGWDPRVVQTLVNQTDQMAGYGKGWTVIGKLTIDDVTAAEQKYGITVEQSTEAVKQERKEVAKLTDEYLKQIGLNDEQISLYRDLEAASKKYGISIDDIIKKMENTNGREHLEGSWREIGTIIKETLGSIGTAFGEVFHFNPINLYLSLDKLHNKLIKIRELLIGTYEEEVDENGKKTGEMILVRSKHYQNLIDTLKGFFSILKLITTVLGSGIRIGVAIVSTVLKTFGLTILDVTAAVGNIVTALVEWIEENNFIIKGVEWLVTTIIGGINWLWDWADAHWGIAKAVSAIIGAIKKAKGGLVSWIEGLMAADDVGKYLLDTLGKIPAKLKAVWKAFQQTKVGQVVMEWWNKLKNSDFGKAIGKWIEDIKKTNFVKNITDYFNSFDGGSIGMNIILGIWNGIKTYGKIAIDGIKTFGTWLLTAIKEVLGIHSPSTEFFGIGQNIIQGLFNGIGSLVGIVYNLISTIGGKTIEIIKDLDLGTVIASIISAGAIFGLVKLAQAINILADGLQNINAFIDQARQTLKAFEGVLKAFKVKLYTEAMKNIAISVAILVGSIWLLTTLDVGKVWASIGAITALMVILGLLVAAAGFFGPDKALQLGGLALTVLAVGVAMGFMARALKKIADIESISLSLILAFGIMLGGLIAIAWVANKGERDLIKFGGTMLGVGTAMYLMSIVIKRLGSIDSTELKRGKSTILFFTLIIGGLMAATKLMDEGDVTSMAKVLLGVGVVFYIMASTVKKLGKMDPQQMTQGLFALTLFTGLIVTLIAATKLLGGLEIAKIGGTLMAVGGAILMMGITVRLLGTMKPEDITKGIIVIGTFTTMIIGLIVSLRAIAGKEIAKIGLTLLGIAALIAAMAVSVVLLGMIKLENLVKGIIAVGLLTTFVQGLIKSTNGAKDLGKSLWPMVGIIIALAAAVGILSIIDPKRLIGPTIALGVLMEAMAAMIKSTKSLNINTVKDTAIKLGIMIGVIAILAGIIVGLSFLNPESALNNTMALSILLLSLVGALNIISKTKIDLKSLGMGLLGIAGLLVAVVAIVGVLHLMDGLKNAVPNILALSVLIGALTIMLFGLAVTGAVFTLTGGIGLLSLVGLLGIIAALYAVVGVLYLMDGLQNAKENTLLLSSLLSVMTSMLIILGTVGILALAGVAAIYALLAIIPPLLLFCTGLGALVTYLPMLEEFMNKGLGILITLAGGLGEMLGAFVSGVLTKLSSGLPEIGTNLSLFMLNLTPFIVGMKMVDDQTLKGVVILTAAILALTIADFINGALSLLPIGGNLAGLGTQLSQFAANALPFMMIMSTIPEGAMNGIKSLSSAILTLTAANLLDGITRFFGMGGSSLASFGNQLPPLGTALASFVSNLGNFTEDQVATVDCAGRAVSALAEASKNLPKEGGWAQKIFGSSSLADFADQMPKVATGVVSFVGALGEFSQPQISTAEAACKVITAVANAADALPSTGGFWQKLFGDKGDGLTKFADNMPKVGEGVKGFINALESVKDKVGVADAGAKIIQSLADLSKLDLDKANDKLPTFGDKMNKFGTKLKEFINNFKSVSKEDVILVNGNLEIIVEAVKNMINTINNTMTNKSDTIINTMQDIGLKSAKALGSKNILDELKAQGLNFVKGFANSIKDNQSLAETASANMTQAALNAVPKTQKSNSPSKVTFGYGEDFGDGYIIAIKNYASKAYAVSAQVGEEAKKGLSSSVLKMSSLVDVGMDMNPTIRPVLDLSDVSNGASQINSMFNNPSLQMTSNLNSISAGMKNRNQNGNDFVSAIDKLGSSLGKGGDTYNINGVSYADTDVDISNAIGVILRAANVERRR